ncbi:uncharacterized protein LTR77_000966 [Saxophila tyrrhenica]|uniref:Amino acid permease/ SLC12A domain-containing protein n=1 Tax=Saxophila tyrrhenica TaxID=1690608 RepID=A0AAV9PP83_9PEZI|nr:hypothetical protein LTR77_000966 [Saxophila tyrrhenica]
MSLNPAAPPAVYDPNGVGSVYPDEKGYISEKRGSLVEPHPEYDVIEASGGHELKRDLKSRHMQMIAIGGAIGAGLFVGIGGAFQSGGPASVLIGFIIIGAAMYFVMQALAELGVMYPVNGAFFTYAHRFISPAWGFATGWDYAIQWLTVLPFEITAATLTLEYWKASRELDKAVWVTVFLAVLFIIQIFGVKGYGETEFFLSIIKIIACSGFIILGIIINVGGVPTDDRGYLGGQFWHEPKGQAFKGGFLGFCGVFVTAAFSFAGTELTGLAAAEAANPIKSIPMATKQVLWRICFFYILCLLIVGLDVSSDDKRLLNSSNDNTKFSPFVIAIADANIPYLPGIFNGVITLSVISVANSCTFGSTRTLQALAARKMAPKFFAYVDKSGRPIWCIVLQFCFGLLAYVIDAGGDAPGQFFNWLLALSGIGNLFIWASICISHIRFRKAWKLHGHSLDELPFKASFGMTGSYIGVFLFVIVLMATFYTAVASLDAESFFTSFLAGPLILFLYLLWKVVTKEWYLLTPLESIDVSYGVRTNLEDLQAAAEQQRKERAMRNFPMRVVHTLF